MNEIVLFHKKKQCVHLKTMYQMRNQPPQVTRFHIVQYNFGLAQILVLIKHEKYWQ